MCHFYQPFLRFIRQLRNAHRVQPQVKPVSLSSLGDPNRSVRGTLTSSSHAPQQSPVSTRRQSLPLLAPRKRLGTKSATHFTKLMEKRSPRDLLYPDTAQQYKEVSGVLMLDKQLRVPIEETFEKSSTAQ